MKFKQSATHNINKTWKYNPQGYSHSLHLLCLTLFVQMTFNLLFPLLSSSFLYDNVKILQIRFRKQYLMLPLRTHTYIYLYMYKYSIWLLNFQDTQSEIVLSSPKNFSSPSSCTNPSMAVYVLWLCVAYTKSVYIDLLGSTYTTLSS